METTRDVYYIKYEDCNREDALKTRIIYIDNEEIISVNNEESAISTVDSLYSAGHKNITIINHRNEKRDLSQEGCMWHFLGETIDNDYIYCMYMNEFK